METKMIKSKLMQKLDSEIVSSYNKTKNQVLLSIDAEIFEKIAEELSN